ncbi:LpqB family beta-propeller domain-containing protein [Kribbella qitaiheensis]|uniref:LpqB family beta-propeller domain-containing protein n=1 Tax=Kribbella qitaiheensis TaxID=1544730 RepID=UPI003607D0B9
MRTKLLAAALACAVLLTGCATVPTKGPIRSGSQEGLTPVRGGLGIEAQHPKVDAKPLPLVNGFLEAMSDSRAFDVAREYMTPDAAAAWKPESKISVYDQSSSQAVSQRTDGKVQLSAPLIGTIDERGSWTPAKPGQQVNFTFVLAKTSGQFRVANVPAGVFLGSNQLEPRLAPRALYFFNPAKTMLVPDPIYVPNSLPAGQSATQLIQELLKGPTSRLRSGAISIAPDGTTLAVSVPVDSGVATVALSDAAAALSESDRRLLAAQIVWTLRLITNRVRITVSGASLLPDSDVLSFSDFGSYDPSGQDGRLKDLYGVQKGKIQRIRGQDGAEDIGTTPLDNSVLYGSFAQSFAVNLRGDTGAIVTTAKDGRSVISSGSLDSEKKPADVQSTRTEGKVLRPSYDNENNLWYIDRADSAAPRLRMRTPDGKVTDVRANFGGASPLTLRMAPDGVRALLVMRSKAGATFVQTATVGTNVAKQVVLSQFRSLELPLTDITDASWNQLGILVAGKSAKGQPGRPWQVNVDGSQPRLIPGVSTQFDAIKLASNPSVDTLPVVQDSTGQLHWQGKDLNWVNMNDGDKGTPIDPVYPG